MTGLRTLERARRVRGDAGTSLLELIVGMGIMVVFMAMFTGAIVMMNNTSQKAESLSQTSSQLNQAFLTLDKTVRYASAISTPGQGTSGDWYVEMVSPDGVGQKCTQLRVDVTAQQLQQRTWIVGQALTDGPAFTPIASTITNGTAASGSSDQPFALKPQNADIAFQQLTINLVAQYGINSNKTTSRSSVTFTAVNSTVPPPSDAFCTDWGQP